MAENFVPFVITPANETIIIGKLQEIIALLPELIVLTPEERKSLHKMGDGSMAYVQKAYNHAEQHPPLVPTYLNLPDYKMNADVISPLQSILSVVNELQNGLEDTKLKAGAEAISSADTFYETTKTAAKKNVSGAKTIVADLKTNFPRKKKTPPTPTTPLVL